MEHSSRNNIAFLQAIPLFRHVSELDLHALLKESYVKQIRKHQVICLHGDPAPYFYIVLSGWVKLFRETLDGHEAVVGLLSTGECLGESVLGDHAEHPYSAEAVDDTEMLLLKGELLRARIQAGGPFVLDVMHFMSSYRTRLELQLEHLTAMNAPQRIGCFLLKLCRDSLSGSKQLILPFDKALVASSLGMKPETFSRGLAQLRDIGVTVTGPKVDITDIEQLRFFCCMSCSDTENCEKQAGGTG